MDGDAEKRVSIQQERGFLAFYPFHSDSPDPKLDLLSYFRISFILKWERTQEIAFHTAISHFSVNRNWSFDPHYGAFWRRRVQILKLPPSLALSHNRFVGPSSPPARPPFPLPEKVSPLPSCVPLPSPCSSRQPAAATRLPAINHVRSSSSPSSRLSAELLQLFAHSAARSDGGNGRKEGAFSSSFSSTSLGAVHK